MRKAYILVGNQKNILYNLECYPQLWNRNNLMAIIQTAIFCYVMLISTLAAQTTYTQYKNTKATLNFGHLIMIALIGLFLASLLVEVSIRYFAPFYPLILLLGVAQYSIFNSGSSNLVV